MSQEQERNTSLAMPLAVCLCGLVGVLFTGQYLLNDKKMGIIARGSGRIVERKPWAEFLFSAGIFGLGAYGVMESFKEDQDTE